MGASLERQDRIRVLVVDDDPEAATPLVQLFERNGFETTWVPDPIDAVSKALELRPHIILLEFDMRKLPGSQVAIRLKSALPLRAIPLVLLSDPADDDHRMIAAQSGAADCLRKPVNEAGLVARIRRLAADARAEC